MTECNHESFEVVAEVIRLTENKTSKKVINYQAEFRVSCRQCKCRFEFIGLPAGLDLNGPAVSPDGTEARLALVPLTLDEDLETTVTTMKVVRAFAERACRNLNVLYEFRHPAMLVFLHKSVKVFEISESKVLEAHQAGMTEDLAFHVQSMVLDYTERLSQDS